MPVARNGGNGSDGGAVTTRARELLRHRVAEQVAAHKEEIARRTLELYRDELVGWQDPGEWQLDAAREFMRRNIDAFVRLLEHDEPPSQQVLAAARETGARRVHQGVSYDSLVRGGRLWAGTLWEYVLAAVCHDDPEARDAAMEIADRFWRHLDLVSTAMTHGYLDEMIDRGLLGRDLLDALLAGQGDGEPVHRLARVMHRRLGDNYVVVVVRATHDGADWKTRATSRAFDQMVAAARATLRPTAASLLIGIRQTDMIVLYPVSRPSDLDRVARECGALIAALAVEVTVGMSGWHTGRAAIADAYAEARDAADIAAGTGIVSRAVVLDDVLIDHMLQSSPHAQRILRQTLQPLYDYDVAHRSELVRTLCAYIEAGANLTRSAGMLTVHPNTVVYRLRRIGALTGRDPTSMPDLQVLYLALKLCELSAMRAEAGEAGCRVDVPIAPDRGRTELPPAPPDAVG